MDLITLDMFKFIAVVILIGTQKTLTGQELLHVGCGAQNICNTVPLILLGSLYHLWQLFWNVSHRVFTLFCIARLHSQLCLFVFQNCIPFLDSILCYH